MKVKLDGNGLLIMPETEFEDNWLRKNYREDTNKEIKTFLKTGLTAQETVGLKVYKEESSNTNE